MAATVLNGTTSGGSISWTNNTGGNARLIINYFGNATPETTNTTYGIQIAVGTVTYRTPFGVAIGKNLAVYTVAYGSNIGYAFQQIGMSVSGVAVPSSYGNAIPLELYIPSSTTLTLSRITGSGEYSYNLLLLPEAG